MKKKLKYICSVRYGIHKTPIDAEDIMYLQTKHFDNFGRLGTVDSFLPLNKTTSKGLLEDGDVLLPAKGNRHFAWVYRKEKGLAMASSIFFVIKPQPTILPEYLAAILNLPQSIQHFQKLSGGNAMPSFSKKELEEFELPLLPLSIQQKIVEINAIYTQELMLMDKMKEKITERHKSMMAHITQ